jgi:hypothetical protein
MSGMGIMGGGGGLVASSKSSVGGGASTTATAVASNNDQIETTSLLHQSCRLYPTNEAVVESALGIDPDAVRRAVPVASDAAATTGINSNSNHNKQHTEIYAYPINIAMIHSASMPVLKLLVQAGPDVLCQKDGTEAAGSLAICLTQKPSLEVVQLLLSTNHAACARVTDRRANFPLHIAVSTGASLEIVKKIYSSYPTALSKQNFHSESPLDIAQRSTRCSETVMNFLQAVAFSPLEQHAHHMEDNLFHLVTHNNSNNGATTTAATTTHNNAYHPHNNAAAEMEDVLDDIMETNL